MSGKDILPKDPRTVDEMVADTLMPSVLNAVRHCIQNRATELEVVFHIDILDYILTGDCAFLDSCWRHCYARIGCRRNAALEKAGEDVALYLERLETIFKTALRKQINASEKGKKAYEEHIDKYPGSLFIDLTDGFEEFKKGDEAIIEQAFDLFQ